EAPIKRAIKKFLEERGWLVVITHGNQFQSGLPDLWIAHQAHGQRWVEVKYALKYEFTPAQERMFPAMATKSVGVWVMALETDKAIEALEREYKLLWLPPNFRHYIGHSRRPF